MKIHLPTLLWALLIGIGLLTPGPQLARLDTPTDWLAGAAHFVLFLGLALLLHRSLSHAGIARPVATAVAVAFLYGVILELAQVPVEGRSLEALDFVMNGLGAITGGWAARLMGGSD